MGRRHATLMLVVAGLAGYAGSGRPPRASADSASPPAWLVSAGHLSPADLASLERGEVMVRVLSPSASHEVALSAAVKLASPKDAYLALAADVLRLKRGPGFLQLGVFQVPPRDEDIATLRLDETELAALRRCERGDCSSKLVALAPDGFRRFDWTAPDVAGRASQLAGQGLAAYVRGYAARGPDALMRFDQTRVPTSLVVEFRGAWAASAPVTRLAPGLTPFLEQYPRQQLPGSRSLLYWSRETFGLKPVLSAYHHVVYRPPSRPELGVVVSTQLFAGRYFDLTLDVTLAADDPAAPGRGSYLLSVVRSRVDSLRGALGGMKRSAVERETREATARLLAHLRRQVDGGG
jgi:hypothetical protein